MCAGRFPPPEAAAGGRQKSQQNRRRRRSRDREKLPRRFYIISPYSFLVGAKRPKSAWRATSTVHTPTLSLSPCCLWHINFLLWAYYGTLLLLCGLYTVVKQNLLWILIFWCRCSALLLKCASARCPRFLLLGACVISCPDETRYKKQNTHRASFQLISCSRLCVCGGEWEKGSLTSLACVPPMREEERLGTNGMCEAINLIDLKHSTTAAARFMRSFCVSCRTPVRLVCSLKFICTCPNKINFVLKSQICIWLKQY